MPPFRRHRAVFPLETARDAVRATLEAARSRDLKPITVVALDPGGHPVVVEREDGAGIARFEVARGKAAAALGVGVSSGEFGAANSDRPAFLASVAAATGGGAVPVAGGVLVLDGNDEIIGAIGVSGDTSEADEAVAIAGIEAAGLVAGSAG